MRLIESLKRKKFILFNIFFTLYIGINLIGGERGLISNFDKKRIYEELEIKDKVLTSELKDLDKVVPDIARSRAAKLRETYDQIDSIKVYALI